jgi:queuosine precursor transporter
MVILYLIAIVAANLSSYLWGPGASVVNAFLFIGFDLVSRDALHEKWRGSKLLLKMTTLILAGSVLSWVIVSGAGTIATASAVSFFVAGFVDFGTYHLLGKKSYLVKINGSNALSALVDSIVFPTLAFGSFMLPIILGQFLAKTFGGFIFSLILKKRFGKAEQNREIAMSEVC